MVTSAITPHLNHKVFKSNVMIIRPRIKHRGRVRSGKGFSWGELREVGLSFQQAKRIGIPIDRRRKSVRKENVAILKNLMKAYEKIFK
jgi:large subunit ribosomal protein L13e